LRKRRLRFRHAPESAATGRQAVDHMRCQGTDRTI
jgi:hypothetical protein